MTPLQSLVTSPLLQVLSELEVNFTPGLEENAYSISMNLSNLNLNYFLEILIEFHLIVTCHTYLGQSSQSLPELSCHVTLEWDIFIDSIISERFHTCRT